MYRRRALTAIAAGLGSAFAGCLGGPAAGTGTTTGDGDRTDSGRHASLDVHIDNRTDGARTVRVAVSHLLTPACRYATPQCGQPTRQENVLQRTFEVPAGQDWAIRDVALAVGPTDEVVDSFQVSVRSAGASDSVIGLEASATDVVGPETAASYDWHVESRQYQVDAVVSDAGVEVSVASAG
ncbi:MAG: hypothetical protein ABEJ67_00370 [Halanaeroarchaeum sp.]